MPSLEPADDFFSIARLPMSRRGVFFWFVFFFFGRCRHQENPSSKLCFELGFLVSWLIFAETAPLVAGHRPRMISTEGRGEQFWRR